MMSYTLKINTLIKESTDAITICFKQPTFKKIKFKPGQYITLVVNVNDRKYRRPYSLSSAPNIDQTLNITIKRVYRGIVSNHLIDTVKEGDLIEVIEPMGNFVYDEVINSKSNIFLWGAGSGITPLLSILKTALYNSEQHITLVYCNKNLEQAIFLNQLKELKQLFKLRFNLILFFTEQNNLNYKYGRITAGHVSEILVNSNNKDFHYICGPVGLKEMLKKQLFKHGLSPNNILSEDFEHVLNQIDLKDIQTRFVEIIKADKKLAIEVVKGKSILEAGLDKEIDLPYSCQTGSCTLCKAKLIAGEVKNICDEKPESELMDNERLLCCSYPLTDDVVFEINDL